MVGGREGVLSSLKLNKTLVQRRGRGWRLHFKTSLKCDSLSSRFIYILQVQWKKRKGMGELETRWKFV